MLAQVKDITVEDSVNAQIAVVNSMVSDRIKANRELCGEFADVSAQKGGGMTSIGSDSTKPACPTVIRWARRASPSFRSMRYDQPPYTPFNHEDLVTLPQKISAAAAHGRE